MLKKAFIPNFYNQSHKILIIDNDLRKMADKTQQGDYNEDSIRSLDWREHIRLRPGMYIGKLGDGSSPDDGIYVLIKEVVDNCIDEHTMGYCKNV